MRNNEAARCDLSHNIGQRGDHVPERHVKLFRISSDQAVRIPLEFELPGEDAIIWKEGDRLIIELAPAKSLLGLLTTHGPLEEDFPPISDPRPDSFEF